MQIAAPGRRIVPLLALLLIGAAEREASLLDAAKNGDREGLRALLDRNANVNVAAGDGTTALHWASYRDDRESADLLIRAGAKVNAANDLGVTPLWLASINGSTTMVSTLLRAGADPNATLLLGETIVMAASRSGYPAVVEQLVAKGADVNARAARAQTALMWAAAQKHPDVVKVLISHGGDIHARSAAWSEFMAVPPHGVRENNRDIPQGGYTPLIFATRAGDLASAKLLVAAGANVNDTDAWGVSVITLAAHAGYGDLVEFFLEKGADPNAAAAGFSALHVAIMRRDEKAVAALLARGADPNAPVRNWTPTRRASDDFNFPPAFVGATPFWLAARFSQPNVMRLLTKHGADPLVVLRSDYATGADGVYSRRREATTALMASTGMGGGRAWIGFEPDAADAEKLTLEAVKAAVELGVDINAANVDGRTALDAAEGRKYRTVVEFLVKQGARRGANTKTQSGSQTNR
jgi:ankyrin repeat protein